MRKVAVFLMMLSVCLLGSVPSGAIVYIDINSPGGVKIPVAVPYLLPEGEGAEKYARGISEVLGEDLTSSSIFTLIDRDAYLQEVTPQIFEPGGISFSDWKMIGADSLVLGKVSLKGNRVVAELRLYDVAVGKLLVGKIYRGPARRFDMIAHKFANEILYQYTGVKGVFDTEIAFSARKGKGKEIFITDLTGRRIKQVTSNGSINMFPRWSPDGYKLAYLSYRRGKPAIYIRDFLTGRDRLLFRTGGFKSPGCFSPDGSSLFLTLTRNGNVDIYRYIFGEEKLVRVVSGYGIEVSPSVSPDGKKLAFVSDRTGYPQIYVTSLEGGRPVRVSFAGYYSTSPSWSPRGDWIAFTSMSEGKFSIYVVRPDGSDQRLLVTGDGSCEDPSFSPDGRYVVYIYRKKGYSELRITSITGFGDRLLLRGFKEIGSPSWSPRR
ncbi:MAG: Tol-Pal system beta propeller repeat protein TolB [Deltaproteobacteria bacterium]|nr:MAG: Tol-Pal system beta propeller repeat protein TolB [Deltaproteobacteria bacterium]